MRLAVFVNQFPSKVSTFFARDIRAWMEAGADIEIFSLYPYEAELWRYVPDILNNEVFPRKRVHHVTTGESLLAWPLRQGMNNQALRESIKIGLDSIRYGPLALAKSSYACIKGGGFAGRSQVPYDHILAYWGNYTASCALIFQKINYPDTPFSTFLHADIDLYDNQIHLREKLLAASNIFVVCDFNRKFVHNLYPDIYPDLEDKFHLHHTALDFSRFPYSPENRPSRKIIAVGRLAKTKGYDYLLRSVKILTDRNFEVTLEFVGDGEDASSIKRLTESLGIDDRVTFKGWLTFPEVRSSMIDATILVHPSPDLGDAVPTVIKEAMALGTPVIATPIAGIPELLDHGNCGVIVPPKDEPAMANAIQALMEDASLRMKYAKLARKFAEETFDVWRNGRQLVKVLGASN